MKDHVKNGIMTEAVNQAIANMAEKGVKGCSTKEVILASFGCLSMNGGVATSEQVNAVSKEIRKIGWRLVSLCFTLMVAIFLAVVFL